MDEAGDGDDDDGGQIEMMGAMGEDGNNDDERQGMGGMEQNWNERVGLAMGAGAKAQRRKGGQHSGSRGRHTIGQLTLCAVQLHGCTEMARGGRISTRELMRRLLLLLWWTLNPCTTAHNPPIKNARRVL